jgi:hypothetical protein
MVVLCQWDEFVLAPDGRNYSGDVCISDEEQAGGGVL